MLHVVITGLQKVKEGRDNGSVSIRGSLYCATEEKHIENVTDKNFIHP
jgi:hypothetical protein